jgi:hypothetical protein
MLKKFHEEGYRIEIFLSEDKYARYKEMMLKNGLNPSSFSEL